MKLHYINLVTGVKKLNAKYPVADISKHVESLKDHFQYYYEEVEDQPEIDQRTHELIRIETWTDIKHPEHEHLLKMVVSWNIKVLNEERLLASLLSEYLSDKESKWSDLQEKRDYSRRILIIALKQINQPYDLAEEAWHWTVGAWEIARREYYQVQKERILEGYLPEFKFPEFPV